MTQAQSSARQSDQATLPIILPCFETAGSTAIWCDLPVCCPFLRRSLSIVSNYARRLADSFGQFARTQSAHRGRRRSLRCAIQRSRCLKSVSQQGQMLFATCSRIVSLLPCFALACDSRAFWEANALSHAPHAKATWTELFSTTTLSHNDSTKKRSDTICPHARSSFMSSCHTSALSKRLPITWGTEPLRLTNSTSPDRARTQGSGFPFF